jgi:hypothetical protein
LSFGACNFLDVVPEGTATIENAFSNRRNAEMFFFTCYSRLPNFTSLTEAPGFFPRDEFFWIQDQGAFREYPATKIVYGSQNSNDPLLNYWDGSQSGENMFIGLRDCNTLIENISLVPDIDDWERLQWVAEVKIIKAYIHFFLLQLYGPVPIIRDNLPMDIEPELARVYREPVDEVVNYIVELIDEACPDLMKYISSSMSESGRITQAIALALKAKALTYAASPLYNGNIDYANFTDSRGVHLFPLEYDAAKWERAADAIKEAIELAEEVGHTFFRFVPPANSLQLSDNSTRLYTLRGAVTEKFNSEIIWPATPSVEQLQQWCAPQFWSQNYELHFQRVSTTMDFAEKFYTCNGLPIDEDPSWDYAGRYDLLLCAGDTAEYHKDYIAANETTAKLNFYREPRYYAYVGFDRGLYEMSPAMTPTTIRNRVSEAQGVINTDNYILTGYYVKKLVSYNNAMGGLWTHSQYSYPLLRLNDLYLLYAEVLNEIKAQPDEEVYQCIDVLRTRAGIPTVREAYANAAAQYRNKPFTKEGMREIIKRERTIELSFEGQRFFDLRRWKDAPAELNTRYRGWNYQGQELAAYYTIKTYLDRNFTLKDYLWPFKISTMLVNSNIVQNPGW